MHRVAAPSNTLSRGEPSATQSAVPQPSHLYGGAYSFGAWQRVAQSSTFPTWWGWVSFPGLVPCDDTVDSESMMGVKPGHSGEVIGCQVDEFTCTWSAEWFVAHSHIYPGSLERWHH